MGGLWERAPRPGPFPAARTALAAFLARHDEDEVTTRLDEIHGRAEPATVDPVLDRLQHASLPREPW